MSTFPHLRSSRRRVIQAMAGGAMALAIAVLPTACAGSRPSLGAVAPTTSATNTSATNTSATNTSATNTSATNTSATNTSATNTSATNTSATNTSATNTSATNTSATNTSATNTSATNTSVTAATPAAARPLGPSDLLGYIATPLGTPTVYADPSSSANPIKVPAQTAAKAPTTFAIVGDASTPSTSKNPGWYRVLLPSRPNGTTAWVPEASVTVTKTPLRLFVDLTKRTLRVESDGATKMTVPMAIGTLENPTPPGATYVTELIENSNPTGSYGPYAYGLALHSNTLSEFKVGGVVGDGQVGIHGTDQPRLIGQAVSHGCVRLANADVKKLVDLALPLGVPVFIT